MKPSGMRRLVVIGQKARASGELLLDDVPGTSGRLDVLLRCVRAAMFVSHGIRSDVTMYLVLLGDEDAPRVVRYVASEARFWRPDERNMAALLRGVFARGVEPESPSELVERKPGVCIAAGGLERALADLEPGAPLYVLDEAGADVRGLTLDPRAVFVVGDHLGFDAGTSAALAARGAVPVRVGPVSLHADDAVAVLWNELDRADAARD